MNYLELTQTLASESGVVPNAGPPGSATAVPESISAANGLVLRMTAWIAREWRKLQVERDDWTWMRGPFTLTIVSDLNIYDGSGLSEIPIGATRFGRFIPTTYDGASTFSVYSNALGVSDETSLAYVPYETFVVTRMRGTQPPNGKPSEFTINQLGNIIVYPTPDAAYTLRGMLYRSPQALSAGSDQPEMPERFHDLIWIRAAIAADAFDEAPGRLAYWQMEERRLHDALVQDQTEPFYYAPVQLRPAGWMPGYPL